MALKGQQIDWDVVREVLQVAKSSVGLDSLREIDFCDTVVKACPIATECFDRFKHSYIYATDDRFIVKNRLGREIAVSGLTHTGYELLLVLDNDELMSKIVDLATNNGISLTADIIIEAGRRLSLKKMGLE